MIKRSILLLALTSTLASAMDTVRPRRVASAEGTADLPSPISIRVHDAGCPEVNGVYDLVELDDTYGDHLPIYRSRYGDRLAIWYTNYNNRQAWYMGVMGDPLGSYYKYQYQGVARPSRIPPQSGWTLGNHGRTEAYLPWIWKPANAPKLKFTYEAPTSHVGLGHHLTRLMTRCRGQNYTPDQLLTLTKQEMSDQEVRQTNACKRQSYSMNLYGILNRVFEDAADHQRDANVTCELRIPEKTQDVRILDRKFLDDCPCDVEKVIPAARLTFTAAQAVDGNGRPCIRFNGESNSFDVFGDRNEMCFTARREYKDTHVHRHPGHAEYVNDPNQPFNGESGGDRIWVDGPTTSHKFSVDKDHAIKYDAKDGWTIDGVQGRVKFKINGEDAWDIMERQNLFEDSNGHRLTGAQP